MTGRKQGASPSGGEGERSETGEPGAVEGLQTVEQALEEAKESAEKYLANWQRAEADFLNYKRRHEQERAELAHFASASLISALLPVVDDLERALGNTDDESDVAAWVEGVKLIYQKLRSVLEDRGLEVIEAEGMEFDPNLHEAVMCVEGEEGIVCEEVQKGYKLRDRLLRPSMVKVGKEGSGPTSGEEN